MKKIEGNTQTARCHAACLPKQSMSVDDERVSISECMRILRKCSHALLLFILLIPATTLAEGDIFDKLNQSMKAEEAALEKKAESGDMEAQMLLGNKYTDGGFFGADKERVRKGVGWYRRAAEQGYIPAQWQMADYALNGRIKEPDEAEALFWLSKVANKGNAEAQYTVANMHYSGIGTPVNMTEGERFLRLSVAQGYPDAQRTLGSLYLMGNTVDKNEKEAFRLFMLAAEQDNAAAQYMVGMMYSGGLGTEKSTDMAMTWLTKSAEGGNENAREALGLK